jgi:hypothetical protein
MRQRREVDLSEWDISVERFARGDAALHEIHGPASDLGTDKAALVEIIDNEFSTALAFAALHDVHERDAQRLGRGLRRPEGLVGRARDAIPFIETLVVGQAALIAAQMPFSESGGRIAGSGKHFCDGHLPLREPFEPAADRHRVGAGTNGKASGQNRRAARRALRFDVEIGQPRPLCREPIDARCRCAPRDPPSINSDFPVAEVVHQDEDDIGLLLLRGGATPPCHHDRRQSGRQYSKLHIVCLR